MNRYLIWLALAIISGISCAIVAKKKGRDAAFWFFGGIVFNLFAVATVSFVDKRLKNCQERRSYNDD